MARVIRRIVQGASKAMAVSNDVLLDSPRDVDAAANLNMTVTTIEHKGKQAQIVSCGENWQLAVETRASISKAAAVLRSADRKPENS